MTSAQLSHPCRGFALAASMMISAILIPYCANASGQSSVEARNRETVSAAFDRWTAGSTSFFTDILAPEVVWTIEGSGSSAGVFRGRDEFIERAVQPFASRLKEGVKPVSKTIWADGDHVIINWEGGGQARDHASYANSYLWILRMKEGKAVEVKAFLDLVPYDDVLRRIP
jgi:uncharacterized protein